MRDHVKMLRAIGACEEAVEYARGYVTLQAAWDTCPRSDWLVWLLDELCAWPTGAREECERAWAPAEAEYRRAWAPAWAEYRRATAAAWAEYQRATTAAVAERERATAAAVAEYRRATAAAEAEYQRATADVVRRLVPIAPDMRSL